MALSTEMIYLPLEVIERNDISKEAKIVFGVVITEDEWPTVDDIAGGTGLTPARVHKVLRELEQANLAPVPGRVKKERAIWTAILGEYGLSAEQAENVMCAGFYGLQVDVLQRYGLTEDRAKEAIGRIYAVDVM